MSKFRKKPVVIEAIQLTEDMFWLEQYYERTLPGTVRIASSEHNPRYGIFGDCTFSVITLEDTATTRHYGKIGDWWIRGVKGEEYFCKPDIFEMTYEAVDAV